MTAFLWTMIALFGISIFGNACLLYQRNERRKLECLPIDILIGVILLIWAVSLLP